MDKNIPNQGQQMQNMNKMVFPKYKYKTKLKNFLVKINYH